jgi:hypothetical protein
MLMDLSSTTALQAIQSVASAFRIRFTYCLGNASLIGDDDEVVITADARLSSPTHPR